MKYLFQPRRWLLWAGVLLFLGLLPAAALAHPLGNFTINRYSRLSLDAQQIRLRYVVDLAEIPTFQIKPQLDANNDGHISPTERDRFLEGQLSTWLDHIRLQVDGQALPLAVVAQSLQVQPGQGGLETLRLETDLIAPLSPQKRPWQVEYEDNNYAGRLGWQEIVVQPASGVSLLDSSAPTVDISDELRRYPQDLLQSPPADSRATFRFEPGAPTASAAWPSSLLAAPAPVSPQFDHFAALITVPTPGLGVLLLALLAAFGWGAAHALTPGHGKTIVAAYLIGSRGTVQQAVFLGLTTTVTHTAGVFVLGLLTLFASRFILPEQLYPWLGVVSGLLVVGIGLSLVRHRLMSYFLGPATPHHHHHPDHAHDHPHQADDDPNHAHHAHPHLDHHHHPADHVHPDPDQADHPHDHAHHTHSSPHSHSHLPPETITWRNLLALGISGGLIPCPSALVVMLSAIALQRIGFGLLLVITFSLGLAGVLTMIGVLWVQAAHLFERFSQKSRWFERLPGQKRWLQLVPAASALFITLVGLGVTAQALTQTGLFN
ncbi:MAG: sulfite exporter TauE/SafE family protein [Anaerolineales bacterium]|nr:sulfite exporter TauE/SafE family protein [Anaerolineales bacterium]